MYYKIIYYIIIRKSLKHVFGYDTTKYTSMQCTYVAIIIILYCYIQFLLDCNIINKNDFKNFTRATYCSDYVYF